MTLTKDEFFEELSLETERVQIGKGEVVVTEIGAVDYHELYSDRANFDENGNVDMKKFINALIVRAVLDEDGNRLLTIDDIPRLAKAKPKPFIKLSNVVRRLNGLTGDEVKNSEPSQTESLHSISV